jgi:4-amino-4-deoxy-L-arabinose transferase-like glycosyltransferase
MTMTPARPWRSAVEVLLLVLLVVGIYFSRMTTLTLRGEETRRAGVAAEILQTGDWIVPRQQGTTYLSRPPVGSWPIAATALLRGKLDVVAIRLPTVMAILLTTLLIYAYGRLYLSRLGAFAAAVAYPTMGQVLQIGRLAETEGLFTLLVASSLLVWHWAYVKRLPGAITWSLGYALAALAGLTKGPQGPIYFVAATWTFLALKRDWRYLLSGPHLVGIGAFIAVLGSWQIPYYLRTDWESSKGIWVQQAANRFTQNDPWRVVRHLVGYPLEILLCMLPWSILLVQFASRRFRRSIDDVRPHVLFLIACLAATFPSVWLATGAKSRYYMPLYPIVAVLIGLVVDRCNRAEEGSSMRLGWQRYLAGVGLAALVAATGILLVPWIDLPIAAEIAQPPLFAGLFFACGLGLAVWLTATRGSRSLRLAQLHVLAIGLFLGLAHVGAVVNARARVAADIAGSVAQLKEQLPQGADLVSLGVVNHNFRYHYRDPIPVVPWPKATREAAPEVEFFCFDGPPEKSPKLPWKWRQVAVVSVQRNRNTEPGESIVVIGQRIADTQIAGRDGKTLR